MHTLCHYRPRLIRSLEMAPEYGVLRAIRIFATVYVERDLRPDYICNLVTHTHTHTQYRSSGVA